MKRLLLVWFLAVTSCGEYPEPEEVLKRIQAGKDTCRKEVLSEATNASWIAEFRTTHEQVLTDEAERAVTASTSEDSLKLDISLPNGDFLHYSITKLWPFNISLEIRFNNHRLIAKKEANPLSDIPASDVVISVDEQSQVRSESALFNVDNIFITEPGTYSCDSETATFIHEIRYKGESIEGRRETLLLESGTERWYVVATDIMNPRNDWLGGGWGITGHACHNDRCTGKSRFSLPSAYVLIELPIPDFIKQLEKSVFQRRAALKGH